MTAPEKTTAFQEALLVNADYRQLCLFYFPNHHFSPKLKHRDEPDAHSSMFAFPGLKPTLNTYCLNLIFDDIRLSNKGLHFDPKSLSLLGHVMSNVRQQMQYHT